jgi:hypothetical protein
MGFVVVLRFMQNDTMIAFGAGGSDSANATDIWSMSALHPALAFWLTTIEPPRRLCHLTSITRVFSKMTIFAPS